MSHINRGERAKESHQSTQTVRAVNNMCIPKRRIDQLQRETRQLPNAGAKEPTPSSSSTTSPEPSSASDEMFSIMYKLCMTVVLEGLQMLARMTDKPKLEHQEQDDENNNCSSSPYVISKRREKSIVLVTKRRQRQSSSSSSSRLTIDPKLLATIRRSRSTPSSLRSEPSPSLRKSRRSRSWPGCSLSRRCSLQGIPSLEPVEEETSEQLEE